MRTFKCRGGLANDEPLQPELVHPLQVGIVDRRLKKSSHCCSPVLAPVMSAMFVGRATFSLTHRPASFLLLPIASVRCSPHAQKM